MGKHLKELMNKIDAPVIAVACAQADQEIFELRLAQLRQTVEMSQHDLAVALDISQPSVANLEKRGHEVKISSLKRYVEALGGKLSLDVELADGRHIGINV
ncbi:MAG: helix-turn-helix transcriptional regulator [Desulfuromonadales bacterium]|nr:helix-turn-helix transcriptional regulator [Desulfuromonadales bacterium]